MYILLSFVGEIIGDCWRNVRIFLDSLHATYCHTQQSSAKKQGKKTQKPNKYSA